MGGQQWRCHARRAARGNAPAARRREESAARRKILPPRGAMRAIDVRGDGYCSYRCRRARALRMLGLVALLGILAARRRRRRPATSSCRRPARPRSRSRWSCSRSATGQRRRPRASSRIGSTSQERSRGSRRPRQLGADLPAVAILDTGASGHVLSQGTAARFGVDGGVGLTLRRDRHERRSRHGGLAPGRPRRHRLRARERRGAAPRSRVRAPARSASGDNASS